MPTIKTRFGAFAYTARPFYALSAIIEANSSIVRIAVIQVSCGEFRLRAQSEKCCSWFERLQSRKAIQINHWRRLVRSLGTYSADAAQLNLLAFVAIASMSFEIVSCDQGHVLLLSCGHHL